MNNEEQEQRYTDRLVDLAESGFHFTPIDPSEDSSKEEENDGYLGLYEAR